ncbi:MAG: hypothetical protein RJA22_77 [Verrucomicrobiota bacterium]|jgi:peptide/nickel transport system ATP-binding protein/oligopeptide transport system ATP-binding protein
MHPPPGTPLLEVQDLTVEFHQEGRRLRAVDGVSFSLQAGQTLCLVGESGSGKSLTALSLARLLPSPPARYPAGRILLEGRDTLLMSPAELRALRGRVISYVFQEPGAALHPTFRIGSQIRESLRLHRPAADSDDEAIRLLRLVGIPAPESRLRDYPHQLSGGMQQRVMIALALASQPRLLVADEPTTALDVTVQAQIIELLAELQHTLGMSILLITHNLGIVGDIADHVAVMYAGQIVEYAPADELLRQPRHPYTRALLESVPLLGTAGHRLKTIGGTVPQPGAWPAGCRFHPRCPQAQPDCLSQTPSLAQINPGHGVRCPPAVVNESAGG